MRNWRETIAGGATAAFLVLLSGCGPARPASTTPTVTLRATPATSTATPNANSDINPLTGLPIADPSLLKIPAVLISISHFPATARPQAGLSFAPFVYEFYITEGATRFLAVFYGEFPAVEIPMQGGCETRVGPLQRTANLLGNFVWLDSNGNGLQDPGERGIAGLCVNLHDASGNLIQRTSTDSNGYYGFNVVPGQYTVEFVRPAQFAFTAHHPGNAEQDSDADPATGRARAALEGDDLSVDAGLVLAPNEPTIAPAQAEPPAPLVGPIRSGRLIYRYIAHYFQNSCLIYGSASPEVLALLPKCLIVFHQLAGGGFMLDLSEMRQVAKANEHKLGSSFDYSGNAFAADPPQGGAPADRLWIYFAYQNQSAWFYDPLLQSYYRYVDTSEYDQAGVLHPDTDRLTGAQLHVENVIVLFARHEVVEPTNLDIHLDPGRTGKALLFRDGLEYKISWSTSSARQEDRSGIRPIQFLGADGQPFPLKPGHTWIIVVTPETTVEQASAGLWRLNFAQPVGAK